MSFRTGARCLVLTLAVALSSVSCVNMKPADPRTYECPPDGGRDVNGNEFDPEEAFRPSPPPTVKVLELTDQGELVDRCQWSDLLIEVRSNRELPKRVVLYTHGWKHNADRADSDLKEF